MPCSKRASQAELDNQFGQRRDGQADASRRLGRSQPWRRCRRTCSTRYGTDADRARRDVGVGRAGDGDEGQGRLMRAMPRP